MYVFTRYSFTRGAKLDLPTDNDRRSTALPGTAPDSVCFLNHWRACGIAMRPVASRAFTR
jgi:hypothetical protein